MSLHSIRARLAKLTAERTRAASLDASRERVVLWVPDNGRNGDAGGSEQVRIYDADRARALEAAGDDRNAAIELAELPA